MAAESESPVMAEAMNKFAFDLHKCFADCKTSVNGNLFYSPASLFTALAMTSYGARGNTAEEIMKTLHVPSASSPELNNSMKKFTDTLNGASDRNRIFMLNCLLTTDRLFVQKGLEILTAFKEGIREFGDAELAPVDCITNVQNVEKARREINRWVKEKTNSKIKDLIPSGMLQSDTRLTLVNAIYFKGEWREKFKQERTYFESFFASQNEVVKVQMMHQENVFKCFQSQKLDCEILEMPYIGRKMSMVIYLPRETQGLARLEEEMTYNKLKESLSLLDTSVNEVEVHLPKFELTQQFNLKNILSKMGAKEMFISGIADFSGISNEEPLFVSSVVHKAFVKVYEEGTEAAAATAVVISGSGPRRRLPIFRADHPFLFLIRHNVSGAILFLGRLAKPSLDLEE